MNKNRKGQSCLQRIKELRQTGEQRRVQEQQKANRKRIRELRQALSNSQTPRKEAPNKKRGPFREGQVPVSDIEVLQDVQGQIDRLIEQMMDTKLLLAGLAAGNDETWIERLPLPGQEENMG
jgi:hypothetical protein